MTKCKFLTLAFVLLVCVNLSLAQSATPTPRPAVNRLENLKPLTDGDRSVAYNRRSIENYPAGYRISSKAVKKIQFTDEEKTYYKDKKKGGLKVLKVFSAPSCADKFVVNVSDARCAEAYDFLPVSFYSFFDGEYGEPYSDVRILEDRLVAGNGQYLQGFLLDAGESEIGTFDKKSLQVKLLADYPVIKSLKDLDTQKSDLEKGISFQNEILSSQKKLIPNHTYLLRLVAYVPVNESVTQYNYDVILIFTVDKLGEDKVAVLLWKKLSEKIAPKLSK